jgi:NAD(P)H-dependent FMN reductase
VFVVISGTNRPNNRTHQVAQRAVEALESFNQEVVLIDLRDMPPELFDPKSYAEKPESFAPWQQAILDAEGILTVVPEYNGSAPGVLKYFFDMLKFPESIVGKPATFVGLAAGQWGALRAVEHMEMVFQYRKSHLFGPRLFIPKVYEAINEDGQFKDDELAGRLKNLVLDFVEFSKRLQGPLPDSAEWKR